MALSDETRTIASPHATWVRRDLARDLAQLQALVSAAEVSAVVIGLPLQMDGTAGVEAEAARAFGARVAAAVAVPVTFADERLTTAAAERALVAAGVSRAGRRAHGDQVAAALLLQTVLARESAGRPATTRGGSPR